MKKILCTISLVALMGLMAGCNNPVGTSSSVTSSSTESVVESSENSSVVSSSSEGVSSSEEVSSEEASSKELSSSEESSESESSSSEVEQPVVDKPGAKPELSDDGKTLTYGLYPQTYVSDETLIAELNKLKTTNASGWYYYNDTYYAKLTSKNIDTSYTFENGKTIVQGETYWFVCEPISWNVLSNNNGDYFILSSILLDVHNFYSKDDTRMIDGRTVYPNSYEHSEIRTWLNDDFYNTAFILNKSYIQETTVDNSAATTNDSNNPYTCRDTVDKVFLPSYQDYMNVDYGYIAVNDVTEKREAKVSDYARANGATCNKKEYSGFYWTRSACSYDYYSAWSVADLGHFSFSNVPLLVNCVRPCINIKIS